MDFSTLKAPSLRRSLFQLLGCLALSAIPLIITAVAYVKVTPARPTIDTWETANWSADYVFAQRETALYLVTDKQKLLLCHPTPKGRCNKLLESKATATKCPKFEDPSARKVCGMDLTAFARDTLTVGHDGKNVLEVIATADRRVLISRDELSAMRYAEEKDAAQSLFYSLAIPVLLIYGLLAAFVLARHLRGAKANLKS